MNLEMEGIYEKPIYSSNVTFAGETTSIPVDLLWPRKKVIIVFDSDGDKLMKLKESSWKVYSIDELPQAEEFISLIKE